ncbi:MAG: hypothetical protein AAB624_00865 [Patescibacteria group bacterium]
MTRLHRHLHKKKQRVLIATSRANVKLIDRLTYAAAIVEPIFTLPQAYQIFHSGNAEGVSIVSWVGYEVLTIVWLFYGYIHRDKMIFIYSLLSGIVQAAVIIGAAMYGGKLL